MTLSVDSLTPLPVKRYSASGLLRNTTNKGWMRTIPALTDLSLGILGRKFHEIYPVEASSHDAMYLSAAEGARDGFATSACDGLDV